MKVLLVNKFFFMKGGAETVYFQERDMLLSEGIDIIEFSMNHEKNLESNYSDFFVNNVDYYQEQTLKNKITTAVNFIHNSEACIKFKQLLEQEKPDLVHFHNIYHQLTPSIIKVAKQFGCKTVLTAHDTKIACPSYTMYRDGHTCEDCVHGSVFNATIHRCQEGSLIKSFLLSAEAIYQKVSGNYQQLDAIVSPSRFLGRFIQQKLPHNRVDIIVNGIDEHVSNEGISDQGYFLYLGRLSTEKGVPTLAKAHQLMKENTALKIVGDGPVFNELKETYPSAELLGFKSGDELLTLIKQAKAVIVPSECYENCSMSVLEAMSYSKPVIASRIGGLPEQIRDGVDGYLFEAGNAQALADKLDVLAASLSASAEMGKNARQRFLSKYTLTKHKTDLLNLYNELLKG
ncbi:MULTISPECIES: glycosyltransferase family 4 protein [Aliivibrio]|jgi:glycosyltransferase involved in cell wall biosynthesis|uniref:Glycosyl transferase n=2 Tax=Aliivibrio logei TaxID=688 RepID=A0A1B9NWV2_ALILO|nr:MULTISPECIES: glycosyltransferase family 4 protein [Aliivibrio]MBB1313190.1 glycosyltransferase family 4 protein [Aliivibrio sp. SR45-2]OCH20197.1 glycosyl transferase [Aliivibrio logei]OEF22882.1 glycosyl transferase [Aliivibrio logei 5S-186]